MGAESGAVLSPFIPQIPSHREADSTTRAQTAFRSRLCLPQQVPVLEKYTHFSVGPIQCSVNSAYRRLPFQELVGVAVMLTVFICEHLLSNP
jgi:hypothetical protein